MDANNKKFLQQVALFTKLAVDRIEQLSDETLSYRRKEAAEKIAELRYEESIIKAANSLYNSDFLTDERERRQFIKRAKEDPIYLANMLEKVCNAADVALVGKPARVASKMKEAKFDPVMARAFGYQSANSILDE